MDKSDAYRKGSGSGKKWDGGGPGGGSGKGPYGGGPRGPPRGLDNVRGIDHSKFLNISSPALFACLWIYLIISFINFLCVLFQVLFLRAAHAVAEVLEVSIDYCAHVSVLNTCEVRHIILRYWISSFLSVILIVLRWGLKSDIRKSIFNKTLFELFITFLAFPLHVGEQKNIMRFNSKPL